MSTDGHPEPIRIYTSESALRRPGVLLRGMLADLLASRELAWRLALRDLRAQYRQAALGLLWALFLPLANTAVWLFAQGSGIIAVRDTGLPYPVYVLTGTLFWSIFMDAFNAPLQQTNAARPMLARINFPREAILLSGLFQVMFTTVIKIIVLAGALLFLGVVPGWQAAFLPLALLGLILTGIALGLLVTPVGMLYTDVGRAMAVMMQFLMFLTPVVYPAPGTGWAAAVFQLNPLTPLIQTLRDLLTGYPPEHLGAFLAVSGAMAVLLCLMWAVYRAAMPILIERMSA